MSILDDATEAWEKHNAPHNLEREQAARERFAATFGIEPEHMVGDCVVLAGGVVLRSGDDGWWELTASCATCKQKFSHKFYLVPHTGMFDCTTEQIWIDADAQHGALIDLGAALNELFSWQFSHACIPPVDYAEINRTLRYAAGKIENGSACDAELALGLAIAMTLEGILKQLSRGQDHAQL